MTERGGAGPVEISTDLRHGGRWTSLRTGGSRPREWLWRNPAVPAGARESVRPRQAFVDAGGGEECFPSVVGEAGRGHDHGDAWSREWSGGQDDASVLTGDGLGLRRQVGPTADGDGLRVDYTLTGPAGQRALHALHLLLDVSDRARLEVPGSPAAAVQDRPAPGQTVPTRWPDGDGVRLDVLGPVDGTARSAVVATDAVEVVDDGDRLSMRWGVAPGVEAPVSLVVWRNLGGWPAHGPYRSIGVEPLLGAALDRDRDHADPARMALLGREPLRWWVEVRATRSPG